MKKLVLSVVAVVMTVLGLASVATVSPAYAGTCPAGSERTTYTNSIAECSVKADATGKGLMPMLKTVINVIISIVGFLAVVMIILGGINFITSQGDSGKVSKARNTILYGVIGMIVALLAFAIVNFVLSNLNVGF